MRRRLIDYLHRRADALHHTIDCIDDALIDVARVYGRLTKRKQRNDDPSETLRQLREVVARSMDADAQRLRDLEKQVERLEDVNRRLRAILEVDGPGG